jgi:hypothetical protein
MAASRPHTKCLNHSGQQVSNALKRYQCSHTISPQARQEGSNSHPYTPGAQ